MREFASGAIRDDDKEKLDFEGCLSPLALEAFAQYMLDNTIQKDGNERTSDNWQKGFSKECYMKSMWRHFFMAWKIHRGWVKGCMVTTLCALLFNVQGMLHEILKEKL